eukprot:m51a1_g9552 putative histone h2a type 1-like (250) ;mRNA; r:879908-880858
MPKRAKSQRGAPPLAFQTAIRRVLRQVHPDASISAQALRVVDDAALFMLRSLAREASDTLLLTGAATLTSREVQTAVRLQLPGELAKHAVSEGTKAVTKYHCSEQDKGQRASRSARAGLMFPVAAVQRMLKEGCYARRVAAGAPVYLAAVLEYLTAEILELSGNAARDCRKKIIQPRHLMLAVRGDSELEAAYLRLRNGTVGYFAGGGTAPCINTYVLSGKQHAVPAATGNLDIFGDSPSLPAQEGSDE